MRFATHLNPCFALVVACLAVLPVRGQEETPFTRVFDTGVASAQPLADEAVAKRVGWTLIPEDKVDHPFSGDAVLLNDKLAVVLRKQGRGAEVYAKAATGLKYRASAGHVGGSSAMPDTVGALKIVENSSSAVMIQASTALSFRLTTGESLLEIRSAEGAESVGLQCQARYVVVPDYFGDDMVYGASPSRGQYLPAENFCLHLLDGGDSLLMSVWQSREQEVWLAPAATGKQAGVCSSRIRCAKGKSLWLAFLESPGLWHEGTASGQDDWKPPFPAKWRASLLRENGVADSWTSEKPDRLRAANGPVLVYPLDRSTATPLTVTCPTDVMRNTLGVGPCQYILACEGLAAQGDPTPNAVMNWVEKQFEQKKDRKAADDIKERLGVMVQHVAQARARIQSYGEFASRVRKLVTGKAGAEAFRPIVDDLDRFVASGVVPTATSERAQQLAGEVAALVGKENSLAACQRFGEPLRGIGTLQDSSLAKCRMAVRRLRAQGKTVVANQSSESGLAQEVQGMAEQLLQKK